MVACADTAAQLRRMQLPWGRDPFSLPETARNEFEDMSVKPVLRGISWSGQSGVALINDEVVAENEHVCGYKVSKITKDSVVLERNGRKLLLKVKE